MVSVMLQNRKINLFKDNILINFVLNKVLHAVICNLDPKVADRENDYSDGRDLLE